MIDTEINKINTQEDFVVFVRSLATGFRSNPKKWENKSIDLYLEALAAWVEDMNGYYSNQNLPTPSSPN